ncbi:peptidase inhibitor family I36 protein [Amycolatopsis lurida]
MNTPTTRLLVTCVASMAFLSLATPAMADNTPPLVTVAKASGLNACPVGMLCLYSNSGFNRGGKADIWKIKADAIGVRNVNLKAYGGNDAASSIYNNTDKTFKIAADFNTENDGSVTCSGTYLVSINRSVVNTGQIPNLKNVWVHPGGGSNSSHENFNDSASCVTSYYGS